MKKLLAGAGGLSLVAAVGISISALNIESRKDEYSRESAIAYSDCVIQRDKPEGQRACAEARHFKLLASEADGVANAARMERLTFAAIVGVVGIGLAVLSLHGRKPATN